jgi:hypothetical protein
VCAFVFTDNTACTACSQLAEALVEYETLDREEVKRVLRGEKLDRPDTLGPKLTSQVDEPQQSQQPVQILERGDRSR